MLASSSGPRRMKTSHLPHECHAGYSSDLAQSEHLRDLLLNESALHPLATSLVSRIVVGAICSILKLDAGIWAGASCDQWVRILLVGPSWLSAERRQDHNVVHLTLDWKAADCLYSDSRRTTHAEPSKGQTFRVAAKPLQHARIGAHNVVAVKQNAPAIVERCRIRQKP